MYVCMYVWMCGCVCRGVCMYVCRFMYMYFTRNCIFFSGNTTCETNPDDNACYCVLDSTKDTDNWFLARWHCDNIYGTLVDINAANVNTFVHNLTESARYRVTKIVFDF